MRAVKQKAFISNFSPSSTSAVQTESKWTRTVIIDDAFSQISRVAQSDGLAGGVLHAAESVILHHHRCCHHAPKLTIK